MLLIAACAACLALTGCTAKANSFSPAAIQPDRVPTSIRDSLFANVTIAGKTVTYSNIKWHVSQTLGAQWLVAGTSTCVETSGSGTSTVFLYTVALFEAWSEEEPDMVIRFDGVFSGSGTRLLDFQAHESICTREDESSTLYAAGIAWDKRITKISGTVVADVETVPINGFWFMKHDGGTGWFEIRALDSAGEVLFKATP